MTGGFERAPSLRRLADERFDVLVVGGGITGAGVALDAASRGLRTALVERDDFAAGTSSKSSKLVHGGLRYLQQKEFSLVYEALYERQRLLENAPHLVHVLPFLVPIMQKGGLIDRRVSRVLGTALWMYDLTGGWRIGKRHHRIDVDTARAHMPTLDPARLASAYLYYDAQADDARLTLAIARSAADHGAAVVNHTELVGLVKDGDRVRGARVTADGDEIEIRARSVVNAAGVWADHVRTIDEGTDPSSIRPAKGVHVTLPWSRVRNDIAAIIPVPNDTRSVFVIPWGDATYIGTTDTDYRGPVDDPTCTGEDIDYLLGAINHVLEEPVSRADVIGTWAGLRPLLRGGSTRTADLSRKHSVHASPSGVVTVTGGKLTTYRRMAADTVDAVGEIVGVPTKSRTKHLRLHGATGAAIPPVGVEASVREHLHGRFGTDAPAVARLADTDPDLAAPLVPGQPYLRAEAVYAVREEMARTLDDVLSRRTRVRLFARDASADAAPATAALLASELGWTDAERDAQVASYLASIAAERAAGDS
ncbi:MAG: glycerol-3-phosphate dehydrogenase/oxidase [Acidimicrobiia bacterium]